MGSEMCIRDRMSTFVIAAIAIFLLGASKAGLKGLGIIVVALMALAYPVKSSTGLLLILLVLFDICAVIYYRRNVKWPYLYKFLPAMVVGIILAAWIGKDLDEASFKQVMASIILISVGIMFWRDRRTNQEFPKGWLFAGSTGIAAGFTTMMGNLAGAFANLFFLATGLKKNEIIGTAAWLFLIINIIKLPFHIWWWKTIDQGSLFTVFPLVPFGLIGFLVGLKVVQLFDEKTFRLFLLLITALGAIIIFLK